MQIEVSFPVRYVEIDAQGVAYYAHHLAWFELGYEGLFARRGQPLGEERPHILEATCNYRAPIRYGDRVTVKSTPAGQEQGHLWITHDIYVGGERRANGTTLLAGQGAGFPDVDGKAALEHFAGWADLVPTDYAEKIPLRVRYAETEPTRGTHYARYFGWFEVGRIAFLRRIGLDYAQLEAQGSPFVIAWAACRYFSPVGFDEALWIELRIEEVRQRAFSLAYRIVHREQDRLVAVGKTVQAFIDAAGQATAIPRQVKNRLLAQAPPESIEQGVPQ